jgi:replicative DNA helicase
MDEITKGGIGSKELAVVIAPTGAGKSMILVHLGCQALKLGKKVVHYTLELGDTVVGLRYDSCLSKVALMDIMDSKEIVKEKIKDIAGKLIIKEYPTKSASTKSIKNHLEKLKKQDIRPDVVIVDYADLLRPVSASAEKRHELESIYEDLRGMATEFNCAFITASQTNRGGLNAEVITMESISEAFNKCFVADFIFSLSRTPADKQANAGRIFIAKNRNGPDGLVFHAAVDWSTVSIEMLERGGVEAAPALSSKDQAQNLKKYYTKLSGSK